MDDEFLAGKVENLTGATGCEHLDRLNFCTMPEACLHECIYLRNFPFLKETIPYAIYAYV